MNIENIALNNKYTKWYIKIINKALLRANSRKQAKQILGYVEAHHIIPKSIYNNQNIVYLTSREHFICHLLLTKMFNEPNIKQKMYFALSSFLRINKKTQRIINNRQYELARLAVEKAMTGRVVSEETRYKQSIIRVGVAPPNKGKKGIIKTGPCSESRRNNIIIGRSKTEKILCTHCMKEYDPGNYKQFHGDNCKKNPNIDPNILEERKQKKRDAVLKAMDQGNFKTRNPNSVDPIECPHCKKVGFNLPNMKKNHFDRCKNQLSSDIVPL